MFTYWIVVLPDFIEGCSLLGAKQCKMYALTLGLGGPGPPGPPRIRYCTDCLSLEKFEVHIVSLIRTHLMML